MESNFLRRKKEKQIFILLVIGCAILVASSYVEFSFTKGMFGTVDAIKWMATSFIPDKASLTKLPDILKKLSETILLSISAAVVASIFAVVLGVNGSKITRINGFTSTLSRAIASISRNTPDAVWAMIFLISFGQNILTGYFALFFASVGVLTRAFIETMDEASVSAVEGLRSTGATRLQMVTKAVIPSSLPQMISWLLYMIETNIRSSTLIGILTGTGIGFSFNVYYKSMNYQAASLVVLSIVVAVIVIEFVSNKIRRVII